MRATACPSSSCLPSRSRAERRARRGPAAPAPGRRHAWRRGRTAADAGRAAGPGSSRLDGRLRRARRRGHAPDLAPSRRRLRRRLQYLALEHDPTRGNDPEGPFDPNAPLDPAHLVRSELGAHGTPCATAKDRPACERALADTRALRTYPDGVGGGFTARSAQYLVYTRGDDVGLERTDYQGYGVPRERGIRAFFGAVDTAGEAFSLPPHLKVQQDGPPNPDLRYEARCAGPEEGRAAWRRAGEAIEIRVVRASACGTNEQRGEVLRVARDGTFEITASTSLGTATHACP